MSSFLVHELPSKSRCRRCSFFIFYLLFIPVGYGRYRKERSNNKSSKIDMRKQVRKPGKGNPPPGRRLPQSIRAQLYKNEVVSCGDAPLRTSSLVLHSISVFVVLAVCLGSPPGVRPFLPLYPTRSMSAATFPLPSILLLRLVRCLPAGAVVMFILGLVACVPPSGVC